MLTPTFYLAGPYETRDKIKELSADLEQLGYRWHFDWTGSENNIPSYEHPRALVAVCKDLTAAAEATLFVAHLTAPFTARGTHMEIATRAALRKTCHVVLNDDKGHMFYALPEVVTHKTWPAFLEWVRKNSHYPCIEEGVAEGKGDLIIK